MRSCFLLLFVGATPFRVTATDLTPDPTLPGGSESGPLPGLIAQPISPGGTTSMAIADACPTFSWGSVPGATGYELAVYDAVFAGADPTTLGEPLVSTGIAAPGLAWTPSGEQCFDLGGQYQWFVRPFSEAGPGTWSGGLHFEVNLHASAAFEEAVQQEVICQLSEPKTWRKMVRDAMRQEGVTLSTTSQTAAQPPVRSESRWDSPGVGGRSDRSVLTQAGSFNNQIDFRVSVDRGVVFDSPYSFGSIPAEGPGTRLMWYPGEAAFRAGKVDGQQWDDVNVGFGSTAFGPNTTASGSGSTAMGSVTTASGAWSTAMGYSTTASGDRSKAMGGQTTASGFLSTAMGDGTTASGAQSTAMGAVTHAVGPGSTAMGASVFAVGYFSTAMGVATRAESVVETVIGQFDTSYTPATDGEWIWNDTDRLFVIGNGTADTARSDALVVLKSGDTTLNGTLTQSSAGNPANLTLHQKTGGNYARLRLEQEGVADFWDVAAGGSSNRFNIWFQGWAPSGANMLSLYSNCANTDPGNDNPLMQMVNGASLICGGAWTNSSDRAAKTAVQQLDSRGILAKVIALPISEWSYKLERGARHIGPMAQDFHAAFGLGSDDTSISTIDADGVALAAIQGLNAKLEAEHRALKAALTSLQAEMADLRRGQQRLERVEAALRRSDRNQLAVLR